MSPVALLVFFLSGFAALLCQVLWQRLLVIFSGADVYSATIIVVAFMVGLGIGSLAGGRFADRIGSRASLWGFAIAELCVGVFALFSKTLYYDVLYVQFPGLAASTTVAAVVLLATLLWPTFFMGLSLPLLARALTSNIGLASTVIGSLYGWNTLGAATGAFVGTWVLLPRFGVEHSLWISATVSLVCATSAVALSRRGSAVALSEPDNRASTTRPLNELLPFRWWAILYGLTGFIALGFEITWFRLLGVTLKSTAFTFGTLLGVYLSGLGLGAAIAARHVSRSSRPGAIFLLLQFAVVLYAALSTAMLTGVIGSGHPIRLVRYLGSYEPFDVHGTLALLRGITLTDAEALMPLVDLAILYLIVPVVLVGPPTVLMGMSFPYLQKAIHVDLSNLGRRLGVLMAMNILGSALGAMLTGWLLLPRLGTAATLKVLVGLGAVFVLPLARLAWPRRPRMALGGQLSAAVITASALLVMPDAETLWARLHAASPRQILFAEDGSGLSLLKAEGAHLAGAVAVYVNGLGQSWIPYGGIHTALGALPALIHPQPTTVLIIGLGSGDTAFGAAGRTEIQRLISVEIIGAQRETLERLTRVQAYPGLLALLSDPRLEHQVGDGRAYLHHAGRVFDIIEADALRPTSAYSGNLYSREYFDLLLRHLAPGGLAVTWAPTERVRRTFASVFPHVLGFGDIYLGSNAMIPFDPNELKARAAAVRFYYEAAGIDIMALLQPYLEINPLRVRPDDERTFNDLNTDVFPRDEFGLPD